MALQPETTVQDGVKKAILSQHVMFVLHLNLIRPSARRRHNMKRRTEHPLQTVKLLPPLSLDNNVFS